VENKICQNCWYYAPAPITNKFLEDHVPLEYYPYCELHNELSAITSYNTCENWESKKLKLINVIKILYGA
jgi:hypothetical protein